MFHGKLNVENSLREITEQTEKTEQTDGLKRFCLLQVFPSVPKFPAENVGQDGILKYLHKFFVDVFRVIVVHFHSFRSVAKIDMNDSSTCSVARPGFGSAPTSATITAIARQYRAFFTFNRRNYEIHRPDSARRRAFARRIQ